MHILHISSRRVASISSAPSSFEPEEEAGAAAADSDADGLVKAFDEHDQSIFGLAWSAADVRARVS